MTTGLHTDIYNFSRNVRKTHDIINNELVRFKIDTLALQETRLAGQGSIKENKFTFFWYSKSVDERREYGVGQ